MGSTDFSPNLFTKYTSEMVSHGVEPGIYDTDTDTLGDLFYLFFNSIKQIIIIYWSVVSDMNGSVQGRVAARKPVQIKPGRMVTEV